MTSQPSNRTPLFEGIEPRHQSLLEERLQPVHFANGEKLFTAGQPAARMFLIDSGRVRLITERGQVLATLGPGSTLGSQDLLTGSPYAASAEAVGAVEAQALAASDLDRLVQRDPLLGISLSRVTGAAVSALSSYVLNRLQAVPGWRRVNRSALSAAAEHLALTDVATGDAFYRAGDAPQALYILERGEVRLLDPVDAIGEVSVGAGAVFGDLELLTGKNHARTAEALEDSSAWTLSAEAFRDLSRRFPELSSALSREVRAPLSAADQKSAAARLRQLPTFAHWPDEALQDAASAMLLQHTPAHDAIYRQGEPGEGMFLIESGQVELRRDAETLARLSQGNDFGEMALLAGRPRSSDAFAVTDANLWVLFRNDFERVVSRYPAVQAAVNETVAQRLAAADETFFDKHLRKITLLSGLSRPQLEAVRKRLVASRYRAGEIIFQQGDDPDGLYLIERGQVRIEASGARMAEPVALLGDGDVVGEGALLLEGQRSSTARAVTDLDAWLLRREDFEDLMLQYPTLALNLSRVLQARLRATNERVQGAVPTPAATYAEPAAPVISRPAAAPLTGPVVAPSAPRSARPLERVPAEGPVLARPGRLSNALLWFQNASTTTKLLLILIGVLLIYLCGVAVPSLLINGVAAAEAEAREMSQVAERPARGGLLLPTPVAQVALAGRSLGLAQADVALVATPTYTPWPTLTPIPTNTPTITPTPTDTPTPTPTDTPLPTPTFTPVPINTPRPVIAFSQPAAVAPAARAAAVVPTQPPPAVEWRLVSARRLSACENRGNHNIFITVLDAGGNPLDGVTLVQSNRGNPGDVLDRTTSGSKGPGKAEFVMWKMAEYVVFVGNADGSPASSDFAQPVHANFSDEETCSDGGGGNTLFHNSFEVIFQRTR